MEWWVNIYGMSMTENNSVVSNQLEAFGKVTGEFLKILNGNDAEPEVTGLWSGARKVAMYLWADIPNFFFLRQEEKIRILALQQKQKKGERATALCLKI